MRARDRCIATAATAGAAEVQRQEVSTTHVTRERFEVPASELDRLLPESTADVQGLASHEPPRPGAVQPMGQWYANSSIRLTAKAHTRGDIVKMKILIADDEVVIRQTIRRALAHYVSADFMEAGNGFEVVDALGRETVDLLLLDIEMGSLAGTDLLEMIRQSEPTAALPVVMISGAASVATVERVKRLGVSGFIAKPISLAVIRERLVPLITAVDMARTKGVLEKRRGRIDLDARSTAVAVGATAAEWGTALTDLRNVCPVRHYDSATQAAKDISRDPPALILVWSELRGLITPAVFARAIDIETKGQSRLVLCGPGKQPSSVGDAPFGAIASTEGPVRLADLLPALQTILTDTGLAAVLLGTNTPVTAEISQQLGRLGDALVDAPPDTVPRAAEPMSDKTPLFEARVPIDCGGSEWVAMATVSPALAIRHACGLGGNPDNVTHAEALEAVGSLARRVAETVSAALERFGVVTRVGVPVTRVLQCWDGSKIRQLRQSNRHRPAWHVRCETDSFLELGAAPSAEVRHAGDRAGALLRQAV